MALFAVTLTLQIVAQEKFTYTPENPKAGEAITIVYEPASDLAGILAIPDAIAYQMGGSQIATDFELKRSNRKLTATVQTDTSANFIYFSFSSEGKYDNNYNKGYYILLNDQDGKTKKGTYNSIGLYFQYYFANYAGGENDAKKAIEAYENEITSFPESKNEILVRYLNLYSKENKETGVAKAQSEIENLLKAGLKEEKDYTLLENLYKSIAKLPQQAKFVSDLKKEKFPTGTWTITEATNRLYDEKDLSKKQSLYDSVMKNIAEKEDWKFLKESVPGYTYTLLASYVKEKKWDALKSIIAKTDIEDKAQLNAIYSSLAAQIVKDSTGDLQLAEQLAKHTLDYNKKALTDPSATKPSYQTTKQWERSKKYSYGYSMNTYAEILNKSGEYKKALPYAKEAALVYGESKNEQYNETYANIAEKALSPSKYKSQVEKFVKEGKSTSGIKEVLKRAYVKSKKSETGFDDYFSGLEQEGYKKMLAELKKKMINEEAPAFALYNLEGKKTELSALKGKVVVVDFWATWCGPCIASFPGMQKTQDKYKENEDVKFLFVNTWENNIEDETKNAKDFIEKNNYRFDVLMDIDDKVITQYKVDGIPTKFIIDKDGKIRFKSVGFSGSDDKLIQELSAMIDMAADGTTGTKAF